MMWVVHGIRHQALEASGFSVSKYKYEARLRKISSPCILNETSNCRASSILTLKLSFTVKIVTFPSDELAPPHLSHEHNQDILTTISPPLPISPKTIVRTQHSPKLIAKPNSNLVPRNHSFSTKTQQNQQSCPHSTPPS